MCLETYQKTTMATRDRERKRERWGKKRSERGKEKGKEERNFTEIQTEPLELFVYTHSNQV